MHLGMLALDSLTILTNMINLFDNVSVEKQDLVKSSWS